MDIDLPDETPAKKKTAKKKAAKKPAKKAAKKVTKKAATKKPIKAAAKKAAKKAKPAKEKKARSPYKLAGTRAGVKLDTALIAEVSKLAKARKLEDDDALDLLVTVGLSRLAALSRYAKRTAAE